MSYVELPPPPELASSVACLWWRTGPARRVLPDGCVDVVWTGRNLIVAGPATRSVIADNGAIGTKVGLRFRVGAAGPALGLPASELRDCAPALSDVWPSGQDLVERITEASGPAARLELMIGAVAPKLADAPSPDPLTRAAVREIARPHTRIAAVARRLGISERQLRRRFDHAVGYSPRTLARVLRLQRFLVLAGSDGELARLAADAGYADQSHLTRDCSELAGLPPAALLASGAGPAGERLGCRK
jgi:AraC-like DNA-binding protein